MKFLLTTLVFIIAYTSINGQLPSPDLTPQKNDCSCIPAELCDSANVVIHAKPCTENCDSVSKRLIDETCPSHLVKCCEKSIFAPHSVNSMDSNDMSACPCIPYFQCMDGTPCTDGCGVINMRINDPSCSGNKNVRCCKGVNNTITPLPPVMTGLGNSDPNLTPTATMSNTMSNCPCVPHYQCMNGTACTDGCGVIDMRINDGSCPGGNVRCCKGDNNTISPDVTLMSHHGNNDPNLTPTATMSNTMSNCPCIPYYQCMNGTACTDGCGVIDMRINDASCSGDNVRCCKGDNITITPFVPVTTHHGDNGPILTPTTTMSNCPCIPNYTCYNGTPCTDGCDLINMRFNEGNCVLPNVRCCKEGNNVTTTTPALPSTDNHELSSRADVTIKPIEICPCLYHYLCVNGTPCTDGCDIINARFNEDPCPDQMVRCCEPLNNTTMVPKPVTEPIPPIFVPKRNGCGIRNPNGIGFRIEDDLTEQAKFGEFPWMVAILLEESVDSDTQESFGDKNLRYQCGGSLIHPEVVLTATHCVVAKDKSFTIRAGDWDFTNTHELFPHQDRKVVKVITHPEYYSGAAYNDIALLILETPLNISANVNTVCLPPADKILENTRCYTSGWGKDIIKLNYHTTLAKVNLPIVQRDLCQEQLRIARSRPDFELHKSFVCAGGEKGKDACHGFGGGPLACPFSDDPKRYFQGGIVSWGVGCGHENVPGLYANVALFRNWIDEQMIKFNYNTSFYTD